MKLGVITANYDKLLALLVLLGLLGALFYLALRVGTLPAMRDAFRREIDDFRPVKELVAEEDVSPYECAEALITNPLSMACDSWTNWVFVPESRAWCDDCKRPIPVGIVTNLGCCTFCGKVQPLPKNERDDYDGDGDGIFDKVERLYGLDPMDKTDALKDMDGDGFDNITEIMAGTRPDDPNDYPPIIHRLKLDRLQAIPFRLLFRSRMKLSDGTYRFGLNTRNGGKTFFVRINDKDSELFKKEGFLVMKYEEKYVMSDAGGVNRNMDVSVLTLAKGEKAIDLQIGKDVEYDDMIAHLVFEMDGSQIEVRADSVFKLKTMDYKVISIDSLAQTVRIRCIQDGSENVIRKTAASISESALVPDVHENIVDDEFSP